MRSTQCRRYYTDIYTGDQPRYTAKVELTCWNAQIDVVDLHIAQPSAKEEMMARESLSTIGAKVRRVPAY